MKAHEFLQEAMRQMEERAKLRDSPDGERVVHTVVKMFNILTDSELTVSEGWKFLLLLKLARAENGSYHQDDFVDLSAYSALLGECEAEEKEMDKYIKIHKELEGLND